MMKIAAIDNFYRELPRLETARLILRKATKNDVSDIFAYASDAQVTRYLRWGPHQVLGDTENYINEVLSQYRTGQDGPWFIEYKQNSHIIGQIHLMDISIQHSKAQVGFVLSRDYWHRGFATEALRKVLEYSLGIGLNRVEGLCISDNRAAARVMEKAGMKEEGELREYLFQKEKLWDFLVYSILH
jgi:[ribosomal protein S5]-alanine N-acetyltransferase